MEAARLGWLRSIGSARVGVALVVVLLSAAGYVVTTRAAHEERRNAAHRQVDAQALEVRRQLERARAFAHRAQQRAER